MKDIKVIYKTHRENKDVKKAQKESTVNAGMAKYQSSEMQLTNKFRNIKCIATKWNELKDNACGKCANNSK